MTLKFEIQSSDRLDFYLYIYYSKMLNNPSNIKRDLRSIIAKDEEKNREMQIKLEDKFNPISQAKWRQKQSELYLNTLVIKNNPSLGQLLANELESNNQNDLMMVSQISMSLLLTITENQIAKYIIERLTTPELTKMNQYWPITGLKMDCF